MVTLICFLEFVLISAALISGPGFVQDLTDGNAFKRFAARRLVKTETVLINITVIFSALMATQMFAGIAVGRATASAAAAA